MYANSKPGRFSTMPDSTIVARVDILPDVEIREVLNSQETTVSEDNVGFELTDLALSEAEVGNHRNIVSERNPDLSNLLSNNNEVIDVVTHVNVNQAPRESAETVVYSTPVSQDSASSSVNSTSTHRIGLVDNRTLRLFRKKIKDKDLFDYLVFVNDLFVNDIRNNFYVLPFDLRNFLSIANKDPLFINGSPKDTFKASRCIAWCAAISQNYVHYFSKYVSLFKTYFDSKSSIDLKVSTLKAMNALLNTFTYKFVVKSKPQAGVMDKIFGKKAKNEETSHTAIKEMNEGKVKYKLLSKLAEKYVRGDVDSTLAEVKDAAKSIETLMKGLPLEEVGELSTNINNILAGAKEGEDSSYYTFLIAAVLLAAVCILQTFYPDYGLWIIAVVISIWMATTSGFQKIFGVTSMAYKALSFIWSAFSGSDTEGYEKLPDDETKPQNGAHTIRSIAQAAGIVMISMVTATGPSKLDPFKIYNSVCNWDRFSGSVSDIMTFLVDSCQKIYDYCLSHSTDDKIAFTKRWLDTNEPEIDTFVSAVSEICDRNMRFKLTSTPYNFDKICDLEKQGLRLATTFSKSTKQRIPQLLLMALREIQALKKKFAEVDFTSQGIRQEPVFLLLLGEAGIGKSVVSRQMAHYLLPLTLESDEDREHILSHCDNYIYYRKIGNEYWEGYDHHKKITVIDDILQKPDDKMATYSEFLEIIHAVNSEPWPLPMAFEGKGKVFFKSHLYLATSNTFVPKIESITYHAAYYRRCKTAFIVAPKKEYVTQETAGLDIKVRKLDFNKVPKDAEGNPILDGKVLDFHRIKYIGTDGKYEIVSIHTVEEVMKIVEEQLDLNRRIFEQASETLHKYRKAGVEHAREHNDITLPQADFNFSNDPKTIDELLETIEYNEDGVYLNRDFPQLEWKDEFDMAEYYRILRYIHEADGSKVLARKLFEIREIAGAKYYHKRKVSLGILIAAFYYVYQAPFLEWIEGEYHESFNHSFDHEIITTKVFDLFDKFVVPVRDPSIMRDFIEKFKNFKATLYNDYIKDSWVERLYNSLVGFFKKNSIARTFVIVTIIFSVLEGLYLRGKFKLPNFLKWNKDPEVTEHTDVDPHSVKLKDRPRQGAKKNNRFLNSNKAQAQMGLGLSDNGNNIMWKIVSQNSYILEVGDLYNPNEYTRLGQILFVKDKYALVPKHYVEYMSEICDKLDEADLDPYSHPIRLIQSGSNKDVKHQGCIKFFLNKDRIDAGELIISEVADTVDQVIVRVDITSLGMGPRADITKFFSTQSLFDSLGTTTPGCIIGSEKGIIQSTIVNATKYTSKMTDYKGGLDCNGEEYELKKGFRYTAQTHPGDCGAVLALDKPNYGHVIIFGLHVAGNVKRKLGFAECLIQENILAAITAFNDHTIITSTLDETRPQASIHISKGQFTSLERIPESIPYFYATDLRESPLIDIFFQRCEKPAILRPRLIDGVMVDPWDHNLGKFCMAENKVSDHHLKLLGRAMYSSLLNRSPHRPDAGILTFEEACVGSTRYDLPAVPRDTSPGYPDVLHPVKGYKKSTRYFGKGEQYDLTRPEALALKERTLHYLDLCSKRIRDKDVLCIDNLKDATDKIEKVDESFKVRIFNCFPKFKFIGDKMMFGAFLSWINKNAITNGYGVGINPYSKDWDLIARELLYFGNANTRNIIAGDFSGMDARQHMCIMKIIIEEVIIQWYKEFLPEGQFDQNTYDLLAVDIYNSYHIRGNLIYEWRGALPSGSLLTLIINCLYCELCLRYSWCKINNFSLSSYVDFDEHFRYNITGDDHVVSLSRHANNLVTEKLIAEAVKDLGAVYTPEHKGAFGDSNRCITEVEYLKRSFRHHKVFGWIGPSRLVDMLETVYWYRAKSGMMQTVTQNVDYVLKELALHGEEMFKKYAPIINVAALTELDYVSKFSQYDIALIAMLSTDAHF